MSQSSSHQNFAGRGATASPSQLIKLHINTTTGNNFNVAVEQHHSIDHLKKVISKTLKVNKEKIVLLFKERELQDGTLRDNGLVDGSKIVLTPNVETGLLTQRAENTVMQALESLNDSQVNDFLSGKGPLNLSVRLGDHMMLIQLQLSTINPSTASTSSPVAQSSSGSSSSSSSSSTKPSSRQESRRHHHHEPSTSKSTPHLPLDIAAAAAAASRKNNKTRSPTDDTDLNAYLNKQDVEDIESIVKSLSNYLIDGNAEAGQVNAPTEISNVCISEPDTFVDSILEQSPIKSLSNLVSNSIVEGEKPPPSPDLACADPISANLTSCLCKRLDSNSNGCESHCSSPAKPEEIVPNFFPHETTRARTPEASTSTAIHSQGQRFRKYASTGSLDALGTEPTSADDASRSVPPDNPTLAEASRNLTQTLRKLSKKVFPRVDGSRRIASGAVIESMKHHGKGIYSGTFSGTLNPALQDKNGKPKRDISTIIHILNDLLSAAPHCARNGAKIFFEPSPSTAALPTNSIKSIRAPHKRSSTDQSNSCPPSTSKSMRLTDGEYSRGHSTTVPVIPHHHHHHHHHRRRTTEVPQPSPGVSSAAAAAPYEYTSLLEIENSKTKYKLDQLRMVMQQKKARREARKQLNAPYNISSARVPVMSPTTTSTTTTITAVASPGGGSTVPPSASSPSSNVDAIVEEVDTAA